MPNSIPVPYGSPRDVGSFLLKTFVTFVAIFFFSACGPGAIRDGLPQGGDTDPGDTVSGDTVSGDTVSGDTVSGDIVSGDTVSGDTVSGDTVSGDTVSGDAVSGDTGPITFGMETRPNNSTCRAWPRPGGIQGTLDSVPVLDTVTGLSGFMTDMQRAPSAFAGWVIATQAGRVYYVGDGQTAARQILNLSSNDFDFASGGEKGLLGLAVDPVYPDAVNTDRMRIYVSYTGSSHSYISRFDVGMGVSGTTSAEDNLIAVRQPYGNHNGGALRFGKGGLLYATYGDGGSGNDPHCNGQNLGTLLGKLLRIDVHSVSAGYSIPTDNPFRFEADGTTLSALCSHIEGSTPSRGQPDLSNTAWCPEIFAWGLRNPFRISIDRVGFDIWMGDVGQDKVEEVDRISPDAKTARATNSSTHNFGWPLFEGTLSANNAACNVLFGTGETTPVIDAASPVYHYSNANRQGVTQGPIYRGAALGANFAGRLFFADFGSSELWAESSPYQAVPPQLVDSSSVGDFFRIYGFAQDEEGEVYGLSGSGPRKFILSGGTGGGLPLKLSDTGCVNPLNVADPAQGLIPYELNAPSWADGADKQRFVALPNGTVITRSGNCGSQNAVACAEAGDWDFPNGTVFMNYLRFGGKIVETRFFMRHADGQWGGYSYLWDDAQNDALLIDSSASYNGWTVPGRAQCSSCHDATPGFVIGLTTGQMNRNLLYPSGIRANQLDTFDHIGLFEQPLTGSPLPSMPDPFNANTGATLEQRARSYLDGNCAYCHRPGGDGPTMDARYSTRFADSNICNVTVAVDKLMLVPGNANASYISQRLAVVGDGPPSQMPPGPFGRRTVDSAGLALLNSWINGLSACP